jgi:hypothetical protein
MVRHVNALDHEHAIFGFNLTNGLCRQSAFSSENSWVRTCKRAFALAPKHARSVRTQVSSFPGAARGMTTPPKIKASTD